MLSSEPEREKETAERTEERIRGGHEIRSGHGVAEVERLHIGPARLALVLISHVTLGKFSSLSERSPERASNKMEKHASCVQGAWQVELNLTVLWNVRPGRGLNYDLILASHLTDTKNQAERGELTYPRSHWKPTFTLGPALSIYTEIRDQRLFQWLLLPKES